MNSFFEALTQRVPRRASRLLLRARPARALIRRLERDEPYEPELRAAMAALVSPGSLCVDVGAHHGLITIFLAELVGPAGRVVSFEAHPDNAAILREAVEAAGMDGRVTIKNLAVTDGAAGARVSLHPGRREASAEWNVVGADVDGRPTPALLEVDATSLDAFFASNERRPQLVKIDVEGAEAQVLVGMRRLLRAARPALALEFHDEAGWAGRRELFEAGYDLYTPSWRRLDPMRDTARVYHCVALPCERPLLTGWAVSESRRVGRASWPG